MSDINFLSKIRSQAIRLFYKIVMPLIAIILLLGVASLITRPMLAGSKVFDALVRIVLCLWFCVGYIKLPNLTREYRPYPNIGWKKSDVSSLERFFYVFLAILFGIGIVLVTWWAINEFLPIFKELSLPFAIANGIIYAIPLVMQYEVFKH